MKAANEACVAMAKQLCRLGADVLLRQLIVRGGQVEAHASVEPRRSRTVKIVLWRPLRPCELILPNGMEEVESSNLSTSTKLQS